MHLRRIASRDLETVRALRNMHRESFFDSREISAVQQQAWFESLAARPVDFYVIEEAGSVVGTISLTRRDQAIEVGNLILATGARGRGLMRRAVAQLTVQPGSYIAEVKQDNEPSLRVFRASGFAEETTAGVVRFTKQART